jgi:hypothetical protein
MMIGILIDNRMTTWLTPTILLTDSIAILGGEMSWQIDPLLELVQFQPASIVHLLEHPSPLMLLPSSHCR